MYAEELYKLNCSFTDSINNLSCLKAALAQSAQYEAVAKLREFEKELEKIAREVNHVTNEWPAHFGKVFGQLFYNHLFEYAELNEWSIPAAVENTFLQRKQLLAETDITNEQTVRLLRLNQQVAAAQFRLVDFLNFVRSSVHAGDLAMSLLTGWVTLICYTESNNYPCIKETKQEEKSFYRQRIATKDLLDSLNFFVAGDEDKISWQSIAQSADTEAINQSDCFIFFKLLSEGLLALNDIVKICSVRLSVEAKFNFEKFRIAF